MKKFCEIQLKEAVDRLEYWGAYAAVYDKFIEVDEINNIDEVIAETIQTSLDPELDHAQKIRCEGILAALNNYKDRKELFDKEN